MSGQVAGKKPLLQVTHEIPTCVEARGTGQWFVDFGQAMFGTVELTIRTDSSGSCEVCLGEKLATDGTVDRTPPGAQWTLNTED